MIPMKAQVGALLAQLRGPVTKTALAERLQVSRQTVLKLEAGALSLDRLDQLADVYGVDFWIVATVRDRGVGVRQSHHETVLSFTEPPTPAPGLADLVPEA